MKNILSITFLALSAVCSSHGQGQVIFYNRTIAGNPGGVAAPVYGVHPLFPTTALHGNAITNGGTINYSGYPLPLGTTYTASLWGRPSANGLVEVPLMELAQTPFRTPSSFGGFFGALANVITIPGETMNGARYDFQVRVWNNQNGTITSWAQVLATTGAAAGASDIFTTGVAVVPPASGPSSLFGLTSFNLTIVPEPSGVLLGALAGAALLWRRRANRKV